MGLRDLAAPWPLVGRDDELEPFDRAWRSERYRCFLIAGVAGVGKSRLAQEWLARAEQAGWTTSRATASAAAATVPLGAIAHLIPAGVDLSDPVQGFAQVAAALAETGQRRWAVLLDDLHLSMCRSSHASSGANNRAGAHVALF